MSIAEFFKRNRQIAGFTNPARSVYQTIRELVENSLDATETHGILPTIKLWIRYRDKSRGFLEVTAEDNGIGIPPSKVPEAFGRLLFGSKYIERQTRGLFGLGVKAAVLYAQMTTGTPVEVWTSPIGDDKMYYFKIRINIKKNQPEILDKNVKLANGWHGTRVTLVIEGDWGRARSKVLEYIRRTHVICPYTEFYVRYPEDSKFRILRLPRASEKLPPTPREIKPHPHGTDLETLRHMIEQEKPGTTIYKFLLYRFSGTGEKSVKEFLKSVGISPRRSVKGLKRDELVKLVHAMRNFKWRAPPSSALSPAGEENIVAGLRADFKPEFAVAVTRPPRVYRGHPFIVEVGLAYGGSIRPTDKPTLLRYANKIPMQYDEGADVIAKVAYSIDWRRYHIDFPAPLVVLVHVAGTKIPFAGLGKEAIADEPEIEQEIRLAILDAARKLAIQIARKKRKLALASKRANLLKYARVVAYTLAGALKVDEAKLLEAVERLVDAHVGLKNGGANMDA